MCEKIEVSYGAATSKINNYKLEHSFTDGLYAGGTSCERIKCFTTSLGTNIPPPTPPPPISDTIS